MAVKTKAKYRRQLDRAVTLQHKNYSCVRAYSEKRVKSKSRKVIGDYVGY